MTVTPIQFSTSLEVPPLQDAVHNSSGAPMVVEALPWLGWEMR